MTSISKQEISMSAIDEQSWSTYHDFGLSGVNVIYCSRSSSELNVLESLLFLSTLSMSHKQQTF